MRPGDTAALAELVEPARSRITAHLQAGGDRFWIVSGFRTLQQQVGLRQAHCGRTFYDVWQRPAAQCNPPTARPGTSKHEKGLAVDYGGDLTLAGRLAAAAGLKRTVPSEDWHFEPDPKAAGYLALQGGDAPGGVVTDTIGDVFGGVSDAFTGVLGKLVEPLLAGLRRIALVGVLVTGGVALVVAGAIRTTQGARR
jgi:hypothetical protein